MKVLDSLRQVLRGLRRSPGYVFTTLATLAIGIGLNAAVFTVVDNVLLRPLGYRDADRIVALRSHFTLGNRSIHKIGGDDYNDVARDIRGLEEVAYYNSYSDGVVANGSALFVPITYASPRFGHVLGVTPLVGRLFRNDNVDDEALASAAFARDHFGSAQAALGQQLRFEGKPRTIVGVLPDGFNFPGRTLLWFKGPIHPDVAGRSAFNQRAIGRRRAGVTEIQLAEELASYSQHLQESFPEDRNKTLEVVPLQDQLVGSIRPTLRLLMVAVTVVLLIVTANLSHLQLVRGTRQLRVMSLRSALGASRGILAGRALAEVCVLALAGGLGALALAVLTLRVLLYMAPPDLPRLADVHLNATVLFFSFAVSLLVMVLAAVFPVLRSWRLSPASVLRKDTSRGSENRATLHLRNGFLAVQVALTLTLSVGAILLARQLLATSRVALGFSPEAFAVLDVHSVDQDRHGAEEELATSGTALPTTLTALQARTLQRLQALIDLVAETPGVQAAAAVTGAPGGYGSPDVGYTIRGRAAHEPGDTLPVADVHPVTPSFFSTMRMPLLRGRPLTAEDRLATPLVVVINEALAKQSFAGEDPVGQQIACGLDDPHQTPWTIVGVVADIHHDSPAGAASPAFYVPFAQHPIIAGDTQIVARTASDPAALIETLRRRLVRASPEVAVDGATMRSAIGNTQGTEHFRTALLGSFAAVSILLAAIGMYGVTAYSVGQRRFEFGLRIALGAARGQVLGLVLRNALAITSLGVLGGALLSLASTRVLGGVVGRLPAFDPVAYLLAVVILLLLSIGATLAPAVAASAVEPMQVLRNE